MTFYLSTGGNTKEEDTAPDEFKEEQSVLYELFSDQFLEVQLNVIDKCWHQFDATTFFVSVQSLDLDYQIVICCDLFLCSMI